MGNVLNNPDIQNQLWALVSLAATWLLGRAYTWVKGQLSASQQADLNRAEKYAQDAAAWALVHFPGLSLDDLTNRALGELRTILSAQGLKFSDDTWAHLTQVLRGFITTQLLARQARVATAAAITDAAGRASGVAMVSGSLPPVTGNPT